jgi:ATP-dependent DNA helicase RecG
VGFSLDSPITTVIGDNKTKREKIEKKLGLRTVGDLIGHHPRRYLKMGELTKVGELAVGQQLAVVGRIIESEIHTYQDRRTGHRAYRVEAVLATDGPELKMTFFAKKKHTAEWQARRVREGMEGFFMGQVGRFRQDWQLTNPDIIPFAGSEGDDGEVDPADQAALAGLRGLFPIYPLTAGVTSWDLRRAVAFALDMVDEIPELLPEEIRSEYDLPSIRDALDGVHTPADFAEMGRARRRFRFDEALVTQLVLGRRRAELRAQGAQARTGSDGALLKAFDARLPFELTAGQREIGEQIAADLSQPHPMHRLLQGEVGSGKTLVAIRAMLHTVDSGGQAALLAPTEVLAQQHYRSITALLGDLAGGGMLGGAAEGTTVALLTGSMSKGQRKEALLRIASGEAGIVVGTHALLQEHVSFADLGLVVVDEQHRFGVEQRAALTDKAGTPPHVLVMTATPIPRTVAMTVFGDLEVSTLRELPAGRAAVQTNVVPLSDQPHWFDRVWQRVREEVGKGHQVYVVCPRIGGDEAEAGQVDQVDVDDEGNQLGPTALSSVETVAAEVAEGPLSGLRLETLHGRLAPDEKDRTMRAFAAGQVDVLIATTVIEVGVDVANATMMVLLDADRFGVSQLHQLRGRVGRGGLPGLCLLVSGAPAGGPARERLAAVAATTDGFELSRVDLEQRREGDVLGASQSGYRSSLQNLRVLRDEDLIQEARRAAEALLTQDGSLAGAPLLARAVQEMEDSRESEFMEKS